MLTDDELTQLRSYLALRPQAGRVIPSSGGARKVRWAVSGRGKRGGARVVYVVVAGKQRLYLLLAYAKADQEDLSPRQVKVLRRLVEEVKAS